MTMGKRQYGRTGLCVLCWCFMPTWALTFVNFRSVLGAEPGDDWGPGCSTHVVSVCPVGRQKRILPPSIEAFLLSAMKMWCERTRTMRKWTYLASIRRHYHNFLPMYSQHNAAHAPSPCPTSTSKDSTSLCTAMCILSAIFFWSPPMMYVTSAHPFLAMSKPCPGHCGNRFVLSEFSSCVLCIQEWVLYKSCYLEVMIPVSHNAHNLAKKWSSCGERSSKFQLMHAVQIRVITAHWTDIELDKQHLIVLKQRILRSMDTCCSTLAFRRAACIA